MKIEAGLLPIWPGFSLDVQTSLDFQPGIQYHLLGANGSGKSSFMSQVLLPRLLARKDIYLLYFEQQMHFQVQAVKAYASIIPPRRKIGGEQDAVDHLLDDLLLSQAVEPRVCYVLMDESPFGDHIKAWLAEHVPHYCLIFSSHAEEHPAVLNIVFEPVNAGLSKVYASPS